LRRRCARQRTWEQRQESPQGRLKTRWRNIRETGEFVINVVTFELAETMNLTSGDYDASINEFDLAPACLDGLPFGYI
jgi:hypothetical protein